MSWNIFVQLYIVVSSCEDLLQTINIHTSGSYQEKQGSTPREKIEACDMKIA